MSKSSHGRRKAMSSVSGNAGTGLFIDETYASTEVRFEETAAKRLETMNHPLYRRKTNGLRVFSWEEEGKQ